MTLSIKDPEADRLAREVAKAMGGTITEAVLESLREKRKQQERRRKSQKDDLVERVMEIGRRCAASPILDDRSEDEILGYDEHGIPT